MEAPGEGFATGVKEASHLMFLGLFPHVENGDNGTL